MKLAANSTTSVLRGLRIVGLVACGLLASGVGLAAPSAAVIAVQSTRVADLVMLDRGLDGGLRQGMVCRVTRGGTEIAEILVVDLRPTCGAALITSVAKKQTIRAGDVASVKILKT